MDKYEVAVLADDLFEKEERVRMLMMSNTPTDPEERKKAMIELEIAKAEALAARQALEQAQRK